MPYLELLEKPIIYKMYDIGTHIDLSYLNRKREVVATANKKSGKQTLVEIGTAYIFETIGNEIKAWRRVPVLYT